MPDLVDSTQPDQTAFAAAQQSRLRRTLGRADIVYFIVAAVISIDTIGLMASGGGEGVVWATGLAFAFLVPYALVFAETSAAFPAEGGPYHWVKLAFGRAAGAVAVILYWITNPIWLGGSLAFIAAEAWSTYVVPIGSGPTWVDTGGDYAFKLVFVWTAILLAIVSLKRGKRVINAGAVAKLLVLLSLCVTAVVYLIQVGLPDVAGLSFTPTVAGFLAIVPVALFAYVGFEAPSAASDEMHDAQRDTPVAIARGAGITLLAYVLPVLAIVLLTPAAQLDHAGVLAAVQSAYSVWGPLAGPLLVITALVFIFALLTQGSAWMIATDRMQAVAAADGAFFGGYFGVFSERLGTPVRMNVLSGVVSTAFLVAAMTLVDGPAAAVFAVVLAVAISTLLISYVIIVPAAIRLHLRRPDVARPFRVPGGRPVFIVLAGLVLGFVAFGSWVALFPGTVEAMAGIDYSFEDKWGISQLNFELFTLGTLAVVVALAAVGYRRGAPLRRTRTPLQRPH